MNTSNNVQKKYLAVDFDKFNQTTTTKSIPNTKKGYSVVLKNYALNPYLQTQIRHVKSSDTDLLLFDIYYEKIGDWVFLRNGKMFLVIDDENITLDFKENFSNTFIAANTNGVKESVYCIIDSDLLLKICEAKELIIRISGSQTYFDIEDVKTIESFKIMCQQFYNNFYDNSKFINTISQKLKPTGECFIATATMGDYNHPLVLDLRYFRDNWLINKTWGSEFVQWYYRLSPKVASVIEKSIVLKKITYFFIIKPLHLITNLLIKSTNS